MSTRKNAIVLGAVLVIAVGLGIVWMRNNSTSRPKLPFTEGDLDTLGGSLQSMGFDDLEGLSGENEFPFSGDDLDQLGSKIEILSFDDLEGLTSP